MSLSFLSRIYTPELYRAIRSARPLIRNGRWYTRLDGTEFSFHPLFLKNYMWEVSLAEDEDIGRVYPYSAIHVYEEQWRYGLMDVYALGELRDVIHTLLEAMLGDMLEPKASPDDLKAMLIATVAHRVYPLVNSVPFERNLDVETRYVSPLLEGMYYAASLLVDATVKACSQYIAEHPRG